MRLLRRFLDFACPIIGGFILLDSLIVTHDLSQQIFLIFIGFSVLLIGTLRLYMPLLPNERHYTGLRKEVDDFITLIRQLNQAGILMRKTPSEEQLHKIEEIQHAMHNAVDRMVLHAGVTNGETPTAPITWRSPQTESESPTQITEHV